MIELNMAKFNVKNPQTGEFEPLDGASQAKVQSDWNQTDNSAEDFIKNKPAVYTKTQTDMLLDRKVDKVTGKGLSTNDYTTEEKDKLAGIASGAEVNVQSDWSQSDSSADDYIKNKPTIPTVNDAALTIQKNGAAVGTFSANAVTAATINITVPVDAEDVGALPDTTKYGASLSLSIDSSTYVVTASLKDQGGNTLGTVQTIDLPLETVVVGGSYDDTTKKVILTLKNGTTVDFSVADLVAGLQTEITSTNKLDADLVDDTTSVHKFVTAADKSAWNAKSDFSGSYNDLTNKPTIPAAQVNADWNATSGVAQILNKPAIYTKPEVDAALAEKLNTADVDADISSTSINPVQNKAIQAPLARLVDAGAKNLLNLSTGEINPSVTTHGVTWTKDTSTGAVIANGTSDSSGSYPVISKITLKPGTYFMRGGTPRIKLMEGSGGATDSGTGVIFTVTNNTVQPIPILAVAKANTEFYNQTIYPMVCSSEDYAVSPMFQPYVLPNTTITPALIKQVNAGAKNLLKITATSQTINGVTFSVNNDGTITANGTATGGNAIFDITVVNFDTTGTVLSGCPTGGYNGVPIYALYVRGGGFNDYGDSVLINENVITRTIACVIYDGNAANNLVFKPMICTAEDYAISHKFVPYAKSNYELTRDVEPIPSLVDRGAKNHFNYTLTTIKNINTAGTWNGNIYSINNVTYTVNDDMTITASGTATGNTSLILKRFDPQELIGYAGYILSGCPTGGSDETYRLEIQRAGNPWTRYVINYGEGVQIPDVGDSFAYQTQCFLTVNKGATVSNLTFKPMICSMEDYEASPVYQPYALPNTTITPALIKQVDEGAKNKFDIFNAVESKSDTITRTINADGTVTVSNSGSNTTPTALTYQIYLTANIPYVISGCPSGGSDSGYSLEVRTASSAQIGNIIDYGSGSNVFTVSTSGIYLIYLRIGKGYAFSNKVFKPMICTAEDWAVSHKFAPYAPNNRELYDGKQATLTTEQLNAVNSGITASIVNKTSALINGLYMVASVAGDNGNQSLEYNVKRGDFNTMSGAGADYSGTYLIHCVEWSAQGKPYIGLISFSGGQYSNLTKTDVVTAFTPTITIVGAKFTISGAGRISVYALR